MNPLRLSVVVPAKNEEAHIRACLESLLDQSLPSECYEVIAVDGNSQDQTVSIIAEIQRTQQNLVKIENEAGITPVGMNLGIRVARGNVIVIAGAHSTYPRHFLGKCLEYLDKTGADVVGGPINTIAFGTGLAAKLPPVILSSPFGVGDSKFRTSQYEGFVDTVPFGAFRREVFDRVGLYNEKLVRNQDNELNARIREAGGTIYLTPALTTHYHPAKNFKELLKYAFKANKWHFFTLRENRKSMSLRHLAPATFLALLLILLFASFASSIALAALVSMLCIYILVGLYFSLKATTKNGWRIALIQPFATLCFHVAYGAGTLFGLAYLFREPSFRPIRPGLPTEQ